MAGAEPPNMFGEGMAAIGQKLGVSGTADSIEKFATDKGWM